MIQRELASLTTNTQKAIKLVAVTVGFGQRHFPYSFVAEVKEPFLVGICSFALLSAAVSPRKENLSRVTT